MKEEDFINLSKALEITTSTTNIAFNDKCRAVWEWSCNMKTLARPYLVFHLKRTGLLALAER